MARNERNSETGYKALRDHPFLMGVSVGVLVGLALALVVAMILAPASSSKDSSAKAKPAETANGTVKIPGPPLVAPPVKEPEVVANANTAAKQDEKSKLDFYKILPGSEVPIKEKDIKSSKSATSSKETYYLQAGAFQNPIDADNLKAKLALNGIEAQIQTAQLPDNKVWHRVRLGPFKSVDEVGRAKAQLKQNQIEGTLIKVKEAVAQR